MLRTFCAPRTNAARPSLKKSRWSWLNIIIITIITIITTTITITTITIIIIIITITTTIITTTEVAAIERAPKVARAGL